MHFLVTVCYNLMQSPARVEVVYSNSIVVVCFARFVAPALLCLKSITITAIIAFPLLSLALTGH